MCQALTLTGLQAFILEPMPYLAASQGNLVGSEMVLAGVSVLGLIKHLVQPPLPV